MSNKEHVVSQDSETTETPASEAHGQTRILARQLARPLTAEEIEVVSGARRAVDLIGGGTCSAGTCCVPDCDD